MSALRTHYVEISQHTDNSDGSLSVTAIARRSGIMRYRSDSGDRLEFVPPELIDARDDQGRPIMGMLAGAPNTNEHPAQVIRYSTDSRKAVQVGRVNEEIHIFNDADGERSVKVRFDVEDPETIADIRSGRKKGVSLGYLCNVIKEDGEYKGQKYTHKQAMPFTIDHLAIVANPRNPGALITRFDSDDVAVMSMDSARSPIEVIRVDGCCAACSESEEEEHKSKKKSRKKDSEDSMNNNVAINFPDEVIYAPSDVVESLWAEGSVDRIRLDGEDFFASSDLCLTMESLGMIRFDEAHFDNGTCGRGWLGMLGKCKRAAPSEGEGPGGGAGGVLKKVGVGIAATAALALALKNRRGIGRVSSQFAGQANRAARSAGASVGTAARNAGASAGAAAGRAKTAAGGFARKAGTAANRAADQASTGLDRAGEAAGVASRRAAQSASNAADGAKKATAAAAASASVTAKRTAQSVSNAAKGASTKVGAAAGEAGEAAKTAAGKAGKQAARASKAAQEAAERASAATGAAANKAARAAGKKAAQASKAADDAIGRIKKRLNLK